MDELAKVVRERAGHACEYCLLPEQNHPFHLDGPYIVGRTPIGRVTVYVLNMNHPLRVELRRQLIEEGAFPPRVLGRN